MSKTLTFDDADVHPIALDAGREAMIRYIRRLGLQSLNQLSREQIDVALATFLLGYNGYVAREQFGVSVEVKAILNNEPIPF